MSGLTTTIAPTTLLRWRSVDTPHGVTKETASRAATILGFNETQLIHEALAFYLAFQMPQYAPDFDALTAADLAAIRERAPQTRDPGPALTSLLA